jgi:glycosyltransferase involved in cell wall biosynthesis
MRVALDSRSLGSGLGGDESMFRGFVRGLEACAGDDDRFEMLLPADAEPPATASDPRFSVRRVPRRPGALHFAVTLPQQVRALDPRPDAVFSVTHAPPWSPTPTALMINDISPLGGRAWYPPASRLRFGVAYRTQIPRAGVVLTVSEFCKDEILTDFTLDPEGVFVVPNTIDPPRPLDPDDEEVCAGWLRSAGVHGPFVVYLGNLHPRKNVPRLLQGFIEARRSGELADHQLVLAGASWWSGDGGLDLATAPPGSVVALGRVSDVQREHLLRSADALAYVSLYEGFGLPPLEAMARGTPVLAANRSSIPEVTGGAAVLVDPLDVDAIAAGLVEVTTHGDRRDDLIRRGLAQADHYSVTNTGLAAVEALRAAATLGRRG